MRKYKKIISLIMLMIIFITSIQNIVIAATPIDKANLKSDHVIPVDLEFYNGDYWGPMECQYICYTYNGKKYPAYCISHRTRWCR